MAEQDEQRATDLPQHVALVTLIELCQDTLVADDIRLEAAKLLLDR